MGAVWYRAVGRCRVGGMLREPGDIFQAENIADCPLWLVKISKPEAVRVEKKATRKAAVDGSNAVMPSDLPPETE